MLTVGEKAPEFTLQDKDGNTVSLSDFAGKKVVVYFYPKDNTPGCTRQACAFAGLYGEFQKKGVEVIGISRDSVASHGRFAPKAQPALPPPLGPGAPGHPGLWRVAGEKKGEALRQGEYGRGAHHLCHRRAGQHRENHAQGKARYQRGGNLGAAVKKRWQGKSSAGFFLPRSPLGKNKETCKKWPKARRCGKKAHRGPFAPVVPGGISCYNTGKHLT